MYSVQQIKFEIMCYVQACGGKFSEWNIGITNDPQKTLFAEKNLENARDYWMSKQAVSVKACMTIVTYFSEVQDMKSQVDKFAELGLDESCDCVYIYKKRNDQTA